MGPILATGEEADERAPDLRLMIAERALQHGVASFQGIQDGADSHRTCRDFDLCFAAGPGEIPQVRG